MGQPSWTTLDEILDERMGPKGTPERDNFERRVEEGIHAYYVGEAIRQARQSRGLTQEQLGEMVGVQKAQISRIEHGTNMSLRSLSRIFKALDLRVSLQVGDLTSVALT